MALNEALNVAGFTFILGAGLQFIGHAQYKARLAVERWTNEGGPAAHGIFEAFQQLDDEVLDGLRRARRNMGGMAKQIREEVV